MNQGLPKPPIEPREEECCGRHCSPCIFDYYEDALARWKDRVIERGGDPEAVLAALKGGTD